MLCLTEHLAFFPLMFMPLQSVTFRSCNNVERVNMRRFVRNLEFSSKPGDHCSDVQRPWLKLEVDTLRILFKFQEAVTRKPCFRKPVFILCVCVVVWCRCTTCRFGRAFLLHSVYSGSVARTEGKSHSKNT